MTRVSIDVGEVPFIRPKELAQDDTPGIEPVIHAINTLIEKYDYVCLLQPTSPLREVNHIDGCIEQCLSNNAESCVSVTEVDKHPYWMYKLNEDKSLIPLFENEFVARRQDLPKIFVLNGAIYIALTHQIFTVKRLITTETISYEMDKLSSTDIDVELDFNFANFIIDNK